MAGPVDPRLVRRGRATSLFLLALTVVGVASTAAIIAQAKVLAEAIATVFETHQTSRVRGWIAVLAGIFTIRAVLAWTSAWLAQRSSAAVKAGLRRDLLRARLAHPLDARTSSSTLVNLVTRGLDALDGYYSKYLPQLVLAIVVPVLVIGTIATRDPLSAVVIGITLPLIPVFMALIGWTTEAQVKKRWRVQNRLANHFADLVTGLPTLQVFGRARAQLNGLRTTEDANRRETNKTLRISFLSSFALELLATLSVALVAVSVGFRVVGHRMDLQTALFVLILAPEAYLPMRLVGSHYHDATEGTAAADRALSIIEDAEQTAPPKHSPDATPDQAAADLLTLEHITFTHPGAAVPVLDDFSLTVAPGELVALTGPSGGGKSTALAVAMGFLSPQAGRVLHCGAATTDRATWLRQVAWVGQLPGMVRGSVADNLRLGNPDATTPELRAALDDAGAPGIPLDQAIGDDATGISAGERRRIAIARALLRIRRGQARLLVLDEPTAGLDSDTEADVLRAVRASGAAALVVTHRPSVLAAADRIVTVGASHDGGASHEAVAPVAPTATRETPPETATGTRALAGPHPADGHVEQEPSTRRALDLVAELLREVPGGRGRLAASIALAAAASGASVCLMAVSAWLLSRAAEHPPILYLEAAAVAVRFFGITRGVARYAERLVGHDLALRMQAALRLKGYDALSRTTLVGRSRGDLLTRMVADVEAILDVVVRLVVPMASAALVMLGASALIAWFDPASAAVLLTTALLAAVVLPWAAQRASRAADAATVPERAELATRTDELAHAATDIVAAGAQESQLDELLAVDRRLQSAEDRAAWTRGLGLAGQQLAAGAAVMAGLWFGAGAVARGDLVGRNLGVLVLTPLALHEVFGTFAQAAQTWTRSRASLVRICQVLDAEPVGRGDRRLWSEDDAATSATGSPAVHVAGAALGWPGSSPVLTGVDLDVAPGERVALVGPSGIGKTTLLATLLGLVDPLAGTVATRGKVSCLTQDAHLFATTVAENLRIGRREATPDEVRQALSAAGITIDPDRRLGEQGATVSGGEARRIALARVLLDCRDEQGRIGGVLLLDEPTEHLDRQTADRLVDDLWAASEGCALLVVTHDADLAARCDRVVRLG